MSEEPKPKKRAEPPAPKQKAPDWGSVLEGLASGSSGPFFFVKANRTRLRLVNYEPDETQFFRLGTTYFKGKPKQKAIFFAKIISTDLKDKLDERWQNKIVPVVVAKTALKAIISYLSEGYDFFGPEGYGVVIMKSGKGTDTEYNVMPSPQPIPLDLKDYDTPEMNLDEYAELLTQNSMKRSEKLGEGGGTEEGDW